MTKERELLIEAEAQLCRWINGQAGNELARRIRDYLRTADDVKTAPRARAAQCRTARKAMRLSIKRLLLVAEHLEGYAAIAWSMHLSHGMPA